MVTFQTSLPTIAMTITLVYLSLIQHCKYGCFSTVK